MNLDAIALLRQHLLTALDAQPSQTRRLFHGRGRLCAGLEHVTVDWLQGILWVALFREPDEQALTALLDMLRTLPSEPAWQRSQAHTLAVQQRYLPDSATQWL